MEFTAENLEKAVNIFYKTEAGQQADAHQWLTEAQNSSQAWNFVWELLNPHRSSEVQFFAATTLHTKLMRYWNEVPEECYEMLKKRLLEAIVSYAMGPKLVLNRLCIALSAYIIHTIPTHWPNAFEELVSSFQPQHLPNVEPERVVWILLEILTMIPEESTVFATSQRNRVKAVLQEVLKDILKVVEMCLVPVPGTGFNMANLTTYLNATRCSSAWLQLGGVNIEEYLRLTEILIDLVCFVYWNKTDADLMSAEEMDLIEVATETLSSLIVHPQTEKYHKLIIRLSGNVLRKFIPILEKERQSSDPNKDVVSDIYCLIINTGETYAKLFIEKLQSENRDEQDISVGLLNCILNCSNTPGIYPIDETSSDLTFGFWYTLQDDIISSTNEVSPQTLNLIKSHYRELVCVMLNKSMFPSNWDDQRSCCWSLDDKEMFRCYRQDIADTFLYCYNVLNIEMLDILQNKLEESLQKCISLGSSHWNVVESCLHAFSAIAECAVWDTVYLPKLMSHLQTIPYDQLHIKILAAALDVIGAYAEWLADNPDSIKHVAPLIVIGLASPEVAPNATMALKDLSQNCQRFLQPYADHLLVACQSALQNDLLKLAERVRIMYSLGKILSVLPVPQIMDYLNAILGTSMEEMQTLVNAEANDSVINSLVTKLKMLSPLFGTLYIENEIEGQQQPILLIMQNTLPLYNQLSAKYYTNNEIVDGLCALLKHTVTTLMDDSKILVPDILNLLLNIYSRAPHPGVLIVTKIVLIMFAKEEHLAPIINEFLHQIVDVTLRMCANLNYHNQLSEKSDTLEAFFIMIAQLLKKNCKLIVSSGLDCTMLLQSGILCLALPEVSTLKACTYFLSNFIIQSRENGQSAVVQKCGESLVNRILLNIGGMAPRSTMEHLADIVLALNKKYCDNLSRWLNEQLMQENFPSALVTAQQKEQFIKRVLREKANKRKLSELLTEFTLMCRGILKMENVPATSL